MKPLIFLLSIPLLGQSVDATLVIDNAATTRALYGRKTPVLPGVVRLCNYTGAVAEIPPEAIYNSVVTQLPLMSSNDALLVLTKTYNQQGIQIWLRFLELAGGIAVSTFGPAVPAVAMGNLILGQSFLNHGLIPLLGSTQPSLTALLSNTLDQGGKITLAYGDCATRQVFAPYPRKAYAAVHFQFMPVQGNRPAVVAPVMQIIPDTGSLCIGGMTKDGHTELVPCPTKIPALTPCQKACPTGTICGCVDPTTASFITDESDGGKMIYAAAPDLDTSALRIAKIMAAHEAGERAVQWNH